MGGGLFVRGGLFVENAIDALKGVCEACERGLEKL